MKLNFALLNLAAASLWDASCREVTSDVTKTNKWTCRDCFNLRANFNLEEYHNNWDGKLYMTFSNNISVVKFAGPAQSIEFDQELNNGQFKYDVSFGSHEFGDGQVDFNAEYRMFNEDSQLAHAWICPERDMPTTPSAPIITAKPAVNPAAQVGQMLASASDLMNDALGVETYNDKWRVELRIKINKVAEEVIKDFNERVEKYNCDPNMEIIKGPADEEDPLDRALPAGCAELPGVMPLHKLLVQQRNWRNTFNRCGDGPARNGFNLRMKLKMRKVRKQAYKRLGCLNYGI